MDFQTSFISGLSGNAKTVLDEFAKNPNVNVFFKNKYGLKYNSTKIKFDNLKWSYNPLQFCADHYGEQYLFPIILLVNDLSSMYQFNNVTLNNYFLAPKLNFIMSLLSYELEDSETEYNRLNASLLNIYNPNRYRDTTHENS